MMLTIKPTIKKSALGLSVVSYKDPANAANPFAVVEMNQRLFVSVGDLLKYAVRRKK